LGLFKEFKAKPDQESWVPEWTMVYWFNHPAIRYQNGIIFAVSIWDDAN
jgi:hypothetical protein